MIPAGDPYDASWRERVLVLGGVYLVLIVGVVIGLELAYDATVQLGGLVPAAMFAVGKFLPLFALSEHSHYTAYGLGLVIWACDTFAVLNLVYALEGFYKVPLIARFLIRVRGNADLLVKAYPSMRRAAVVGVVVVVLFPVSGTGPLAGTFLGILLGLKRWVTIACVSLGGLLGGMIMAFLTVHFEPAVIGLRSWQSTPAVKYTVIAVAVTVLLLIVFFISRKFQRVLDRAREADLDHEANPL